MKLAQNIFKEGDSLFLNFIKKDKIIYKAKIGDLISLVLPMVFKVFVLNYLVKYPREDFHNNDKEIERAWVTLSKTFFTLEETLELTI